MPEPKLTAKQKKFCLEYLVDGNATQSAIRAGYSAHTAYSIGVENLKKPQIRAFLDELLAQQSERTKMTADQVIEKLTAIASFQVTDVIEYRDGKLFVKPSSEWNETAKTAVEVLKIDRDGCVTVRSHSKIQALKQLGEHFGLFTDFSIAIAALNKYGTIIELEDGSGGFQFRQGLMEDHPPFKETFVKTTDE
jgi:phage terminase small subunit